MRTDLRVKHDVEVRRRASELFERGYGRISTAKALRVPRQTVEKWQQIYRAIGREALLSMGGKQASYTYEQKMAAASAVVDGGATKAEAMAEFGIMSLAPLERWCRLYREGGAEALEPKPKGRPKGSRSKPRERTREQELEERCRRLETEIYALSHPAKPTRPELREAVAEIFMRTANGCGHRQVAMCLRAELGARVADKTVLKIMREMGIRCGIRRETDYHRYNSYRGVVGETFENIVGRDFSADGPWRKMGTDVTEFKQPWGKAYFAPVYDFGSKEIVAWSTSTSPDMEQQADLLDRLLERMPEGARPVLHSDMGWQYQHAGWCGRLKAAGIVQSMSRKGNCIDNGATEQVFGHIKDEFFRGRTWPDFESFKADLDDYVVHWNTRRRQVKLKGLTPEEFRSQSLVA